MGVVEKWTMIAATIFSLCLGAVGDDSNVGGDYDKTQLGKTSIDALHHSQKPNWDKPNALLITGTWFATKGVSFFLLERIGNPELDDSWLSANTVLSCIGQACTVVAAGLTVWAYRSNKHIRETEGKIYDDRRTLGLLLDSAYDLMNPEITEKSAARNQLTKFLNIINEDYKATYPDVEDHVATLAEKLIYANEAGLFIDLSRYFSRHGDELSLANENIEHKSSKVSVSEIPNFEVPFKPLGVYQNLDVYFNDKDSDYLNSDVLQRQIVKLRSYIIKWGLAGQCLENQAPTSCHLNDVVVDD